MPKVLVNFQDDFLKEVDNVAQLERRTRSSLIREALRRYVSQYKNESIQKGNDIQLKSEMLNKITFPVTLAS